VRAAPSLGWDLGQTDGTVALRMPNHEFVLELLRNVGPMAVSSANTHGRPPATSAQEAYQMLGETVSVYVEGGPSPLGAPSTIVDVTGPIPAVVRVGAISIESIRSEVAETALRRASG
jgi:tRNA threonylcarbamoyl adenosine modification protein (Sua5/YciO/YrdC/YwlC family)